MVTQLRPYHSQFFFCIPIQCAPLLLPRCNEKIHYTCLFVARIHARLYSTSFGLTLTNFVVSLSRDFEH
jgi:hypothetical protein